MTNPPSPSPSSFGGGHAIGPGSPSVPHALRLLIWLKWTLIWRAYSRQRVRMIGAIVMLLCFAPLSVGGAVLCYLYGHDSSVTASFLARAVLMIVYAVWLVTPLLGFPLNESYDPGRLFAFPVPLRTIFAASVLGGLFELSTILAIPLLVALDLLFSKGFAAAFISACALLLFLLHTLGVSQLILLSMIGFLRSRRFRDITIVLLPLIAMIFFVIQQTAVRGLIEFNPYSILAWPVWRIADWLPPGWAARAAELAGSGNYAAAAGYLALLAIATAVPISLAAVTLNNLYMGDRGPDMAAGSSRRQPEAAELEAKPAGLTGQLHQEFWALARKERTYLVREPQYKALAVSTLYTIVVMFFAFGGMRHGPPVFSPTGSSPDMDAFSASLDESVHVLRLFTLPTMLLLATLSLTFNIFGGDGSAITMLLSFPTPRRKIIMSKNFAYGPIVVGVAGLGVIAGMLLLRDLTLQSIATELGWILLATPIVTGAGNIVSVRFPHKMVIRGQRWSRGGQVTFGSGPTGCGFAILYLLCYLAAFAALLPIAAAVIGPILLGNTTIYFATIPLAIVYACVVYWGATTYAVDIMMRRESEIVAALAPEE